MKNAWFMLLASRIDSGTPSSGSTPTSAAAWSCEEDAEKWGYSNQKGAAAEEAWGTAKGDLPLKWFADGEKQIEPVCMA